jgi:hypothetical protein
MDGIISSRVSKKRRRSLRPRVPESAGLPQVVLNAPLTKTFETASLNEAQNTRFQHSDIDVSMASVSRS